MEIPVVHAASRVSCSALCKFHIDVFVFLFIIIIIISLLSRKLALNGLGGCETVKITEVTLGFIFLKLIFTMFIIHKCSKG